MCFHKYSFLEMFVIVSNKTLEWKEWKSINSLSYAHYSEPSITLLLITNLVSICIKRAIAHQVIIIIETFVIAYVHIFTVCFFINLQMGDVRLTAALGTNVYLAKIHGVEHKQNTPFDLTFYFLLYYVNSLYSC